MLYKYFIIMLLLLLMVVAVDDCFLLLFLLLLQLLFPPPAPPLPLIPHCINLMVWMVAYFGKVDTDIFGVFLIFCDSLEAAKPFSFGQIASPRNIFPSACIFPCEKGAHGGRREPQLVIQNKSNRITMRPLGIYLIGIFIYILNMIHFMMILVNFGGFSLMLTDIRTEPRTDGRTDGQTLI